MFSVILIFLLGGSRADLVDPVIADAAGTMAQNGVLAPSGASVLCFTLFVVPAPRNLKFFSAESLTVAKLDHGKWAGLDDLRGAAAASEEVPGYGLLIFFVVALLIVSALVGLN